MDTSPEKMTTEEDITREEEYTEEEEYSEEEENTSERQFRPPYFIVTLILVLLFALNEVVLANRSYKQSKESYRDLEQYVSENTQETESGEADPAEEQTVAPISGEEYKIDLYRKLQDIGADFEALRKINSDVVGWVCVQGTKINYPVVQTDDNSYYLRHLFTGEYNVSGCVFLDCNSSSSFSSRRSILYGHRMDDGTMFTAIQNYKKQSYYDSHPYGLIYTPGGNYVIEFFAGYVASESDDAWDMSFYSDAAFGEWIEEQISRSDFDAGFVPGTGDKIITLSTCSHAFQNARYVLHGVLKNKAG